MERKVGVGGNGLTGFGGVEENGGVRTRVLRLASKEPDANNRRLHRWKSFRRMEIGERPSIPTFPVFVELRWGLAWSPYRWFRLNRMQVKSLALKRALYSFRCGGCLLFACRSKHD